MRDPKTIEWLTIGVMGIVTFWTRVAGVGMSGLIPQTPFWQRFMQYLPGTLLVAIALPAFVAGDVPLTIAAVVTLLAAMFGLHMVVCMTIGVATMALLRLVLA